MNQLLIDLALKHAREAMGPDAGGHFQFLVRDAQALLGLKDDGSPESDSVLARFHTGVWKKLLAPGFPS